MSMNQLEEFKEGSQYSDEVRNAVRYGYQYRIEAEKPESRFVHHCLLETSQVLLWLGQKIIDGLVFDAFKAIAKKLFEYLIQKGAPLEKDANNLLTDERELQMFYKYVKEFNEHTMSVTENQFH